MLQNYYFGQTMVWSMLRDHCLWGCVELWRLLGLNSAAQILEISAPVRFLAETGCAWAQSQNWEKSKLKKAPSFLWIWWLDLEMLRLPFQLRKSRFPRTTVLIKNLAEWQNWFGKIQFFYFSLFHSIAWHCRITHVEYYCNFAMQVLFGISSTFIGDKSAGLYFHHRWNQAQSWQLHYGLFHLTWSDTWMVVHNVWASTTPHRRALTVLI